MHEHMEIYLNIGLKCHKGQHRYTQNKWDTAQSKFWKNLPKNKVPNPFFEKFPILEP